MTTIQTSYLSRISQIICVEKSAQDFHFFLLHRPHICHRYHRLYPWRKICHVEKFQISVKNLNNLWSFNFIEIYAVFVLNLCGENFCREKMTIMRSVVVYMLPDFRGGVKSILFFLMQLKILLSQTGKS